MKPVCSVVIATLNRSASLRGTLERVLQQDLGDPYEVIVVDNGSTDDTPAVVAEYSDRCPSVRYAFEPTPGPAAARNAGVALAKADIVAFTDDDIRPTTPWLRSLVRTFASRPDIDCCGGRILPVWPGPLPGWLTKDHWTGALALQDYGDEPLAIGVHRPLSLASANLAIRRSTLLASGGFDADYKYAEDTELLLRLWRAGFHCLYVPEAVVFADVQPERLTKRYHRRWHRRNGWWAARMRLEESFDVSGHLRDAPADAPKLFGVPGFLYWQLLANALRYGSAAVTQRPGALFHREKHLWQLACYIRARAMTRTSRPGRGRLTEVKEFLMALARKKLPWLPFSRS